MRLVDDPCDAITGPARGACNTSGGSGGGGIENGADPAESLDPLHNLAMSVAKAGAWVARKVGDVLDGQLPTADFTNAAFLQQYAVVFAASVFITALLWLSAVMKRVTRAVPFTQAVVEAVGLLWLSVLVSAFSPLALYVVAQAASALARGIGAAIGIDGSVFEALATTLEEGQMGGGSIMLILVSLVAIVLCGAVLLLMVLRALGLYVGALAGIPIHAGLVDRDLWQHSRKWAAFMAGMLAIEPVLVVVVGLSAAVQADGDVVTGLGVTAIALGAVVMLIVRLPAWGDSVRVMRQTARATGAVGGAVLGTGGAAKGVMQGIHTHGGRGATAPARTESGPSKDSSSGGISGGVSAHGSRAPKPRTGSGRGADKTDT